MLIQRVPDFSPSPQSPKRCLDQESGGPVGLGIVAALDKSIILNSPAKLTVNTAPVAITSLRPARCREDSHRHREKRRDEGLFCGTSRRSRDKEIEKRRDEGLFCGTSPRSSDKEILVTGMDFLSHCSLCRKQLHGKDIYMYQEKAFCSIDCRDQKMVSDEKEKCRRTKTPKTMDIPCSPCSGRSRLFFTSVVAA